MRDSNETPDGLWRANRIGVRTLGLRPQVVGQTREGQQIFEVRSARLLLGSTSTHFRRLVECSECGRELAGSAVLSREDLEVPVPPTICGQCSGRVTAGPASVEPDEDQVDAVNELVRRAMGEQAQVLERQEQAPGLEAERAEVQPRAAGAEALSTSFSEPLVDQVRQDVAVVDPQTTQTAALAASVDSNRAALRQVIESQQEIELRLADLEARSARTEPDAADLAEAGARTQHEVDQLRETLRAAALREQQVSTAVSDLRAMVAALRSDLESSAHAQLDRLAAQVERHAALSASVETLTAAVREGARRNQFFEHRMEDAVERLSERLDDRRKELLEATDDAAHQPAADARAGSLLDALDDQLRAVEDRLAKRIANGPA